MRHEPFTIRDSSLSRIDTRLKIIFILLFSFAVALSENWIALVFSLAVSILAVFLSRLDFPVIVKRLFLAFGFILFLWLVLPFTASGDPLYRIGPLTLTWAGIALAARITLKSSSLILVFLALTGSSSIAAIGHALQRLGLSEKLVYLLLFCYRYIFVIEQEYRRLEKAIRLRSFRPGTDLHTYRTYAYLVAMLFLRSSLRADQVHKAMLCRGFHGRFYCLEKSTFRGQDCRWAAGMGLVLFLVIALEWLKLPS